MPFREPAGGADLLTAGLPIATGSPGTLAGAFSPGANVANFIRPTTGESQLISSLWIASPAPGVGTNIELAIYDGLPGMNPPTVQLATTGSVILLAGWNGYALVTPIIMEPGHYFAFACDAALATFAAVGAGGLYTITDGFNYTEAAAFPLPAIATPVSAGGTQGLFMLAAS